MTREVPYMTLDFCSSSCEPTGFASRKGPTTCEVNRCAVCKIVPLECNLGCGQCLGRSDQQGRQAAWGRQLAYLLVKRRAFRNQPFGRCEVSHRGCTDCRVRHDVGPYQHEAPAAGGRVVEIPESLHIPRHGLLQLSLGPQGTRNPIGAATPRLFMLVTFFGSSFRSVREICCER